MWYNFITKFILKKLTYHSDTLNFGSILKITLISISVLFIYFGFILELIFVQIVKKLNKNGEVLFYKIGYCHRLKITTFCFSIKKESYFKISYHKE